MLWCVISWVDPHQGIVLWKSLPMQVECPWNNQMLGLIIPHPCLTCTCPGWGTSHSHVCLPGMWTPHLQCFVSKQKCLLLTTYSWALGPVMYCSESQYPVLTDPQWWRTRPPTWPGLSAPPCMKHDICCGGSLVTSSLNVKHWDYNISIKEDDRDTDCFGHL